MPNKSSLVAGCRGDPFPENADIDFIRVAGEWYKIKALTAYVGISSTTGEAFVAGAATYNIDGLPPWGPLQFDRGIPGYERHSRRFFDGSLDPTAFCSCK